MAAIRKHPSVQTKKTSPGAAPQPPEAPHADASKSFESSDSLHLYYLQMYDDDCEPMSREEEDSIWREIDAEMGEVRSLLARFIFVLEEHERLIDSCSSPDAVGSLFWESMLPEAYRKNPSALLPVLPSWRAEISAMRAEMSAFYTGRKSGDARLRCNLWTRSAALLMRYPVSPMKIYEWYRVAAAYCAAGESTRMSGELERKLMPNRAECLDILSVLRSHFDRQEGFRQRILSAHLRLVISVVKQACSQSQQMNDLIQEGNLGLVKALNRFDYKLGHKFSTYATWWIRHNVMQAIANQSRVIRLPPHMVATIAQINRAEQSFIKRCGTEPTIDDLARELDMPKARVHAIRQMALQPISLQKSISDDSDAELEDLIGDAGESADAADPEQRLAFKFLRDGVHKALEKLSEREQLLIKMRFGLDGHTAMTVSAVAALFNLTRERVRQIEIAAFRKLRNPELASHFHDYHS